MLGASISLRLGNPTMADAEAVCAEESAVTNIVVRYGGQALASLTQILLAAIDLDKVSLTQLSPPFTHLLLAQYSSLARPDSH